MATTLTDDLTRVAVADIEKWEESDGTVYVYGRCTTPEVDTDDQVVASEWSGPALKEYLSTAPTVRVQHNAQRDPAGSAVRVDVNRDGDGAHWLKAAVDEPVAQRLVKKGHLRAFSVGIARPVIERDITGKARGGVIKGGKIVEVSLVDSPANRSCFLEIAKSAADGACEFTGKVFADDDVLQKALGADVTKSAPADDDFVNVDLPKGASISISPADFAKLHTFKQQLTTKAATADTEKRDVDTAERRSLASDGDALPDGSYPIKNTGDLHDAALLARSGHGDVAAARRLIARRAGELGVANPLDESDEVGKSVTVTPEENLLTETFSEPAVEKAEAPAGETATPDVAKETDASDAPVKKAKKKAKGPKKMPPWLNGDGKDADDDACKSVSDHLWTGVEGTSDIECSKCHTTPAEAAKVTAAPMDPAPVGELLESQPPVSTKSGPTPASASGAEGEHMTPVPAHREPDGAPMEALEADAGLSDGDDEKPTRLEAATGMKSADLAPDPEVAALLRFKAIGADEDMGRLHDLTCPAFHPDEVAKYHPFAEIGGLIDSRAWQQKALAAAAGPIGESLKGQDLWEAAFLLKTADPGDINDWRLAAYKAFRDANPGPGSFPTPGSLNARGYCRPVLAGGRAANAVDYAAPTTAPQVADGAPNAASFDRPPLAASHQSPSPSHMKGDGEYPAERGVPVQLSYAQTQKDHQRQALVRMHDHLSRQTPDMCPLGAEGVMQPENHPVPVPAGIGKSDAVEVPLEQGEAVVPAAALKSATGTDVFADDAVYKGFKKMRKKLGKKVLAGEITVDEARAKMGRQFAQKGTEPPAEALQNAGDAPVVKSAERPVVTAIVPAPAASPVAAALDPEVIKSAVADAVSPLIERIEKADQTIGELRAENAENKRVLDALADQPDPSTAAFSGLAFQPGVQKARRPAAVPDQAEYAARAQEMVRRNLQNTYSTHSNPHVREAASEALARLGTPEVAS